jgi:hypothetical protein
MNHPKTLAQAQKWIYGKTPTFKGHQFNRGRCAMPVWTGYHEFQCLGNDGYGPEKLFCKYHAEELEDK